VHEQVIFSVIILFLNHLHSADEFAEKAEKQHTVSFITKSNALRKAAKKKDSELEADGPTAY